MTALSSNPHDFAARDFDYLIVGGGTAGLVVAARLSEDPSVVVGVLEAGPAALNEDAINVPDPFLRTLGTKYDWQFETIRQDGLGGRTLPWPRGKVLGGTSALNLMTWNRGSKQDYDAWEELGNKGWGWDGLLSSLRSSSRPFFKKSETMHLPGGEKQSIYREYYDPESIGTSGPVHASYSKQYSKTHQLCYDALVGLGVPENRAHQGGSNVGVWTNLTSVNPEDDTRSYAAPAYFKPNSSKKNFVVLTEALVQEIVLSQEDGGAWIATGVRFTYGNDTFIASASREVILSAGSIQSPQLLELSGIGNSRILKDAGIEVKVPNHNVGENLQDHLMTISVFEIDPSLEMTNLGAPACPYCYLPIPLATSGGMLEQLTDKIEALGLFDPDEKEILQTRFKSDANLGHFEYIFDLGNWSSYFRPEPSDDKKYASVLQILQYPFSRGSIHIRKPNGSGSNANDPATITDKPVIDPRYYSGPHGELDLEIMTQCIRFSDRLCRSAPLSDFVRSRVAPSPSITSDDDVRDWVVRNTTTDWHPVGTCSMGGRRGIQSGVVDDRLRVYGVNRLRVIDASIMPLQISAHLQATVYAIAEKGADLIREDNIAKRQ
ncbi:hypothetical protein AAE478_010400 [Parahypoxylon ruwenzoriense]